MPEEMFDDPVPLDEDDPEVQQEMFETFKEMNCKPDDIKDKKLSKLYAKWLKSHKEPE